jgi:hypothetical protein
MTPIIDKENPTIKANTTLGNRMFKNISELKASAIEIEIVPMKGAITKVRIPVSINKSIKNCLLFIFYCIIHLSNNFSFLHPPIQI